jgi:multicomponent Na+:H+ antiporter subunit E
VTTPSGGPDAVGFASAALGRCAGFFCLWLVIFGIAAPDLAVGAAAAAAAAWTSLHLLPPVRARLRPVALARLVLRFFWQSAIAGADVAWRALDPRLPLRPGFVRCPLRVAPGPARDAFCALTSLQPGTLPVGSEGGDTLLMHCLDVGQPVSAQLAEEEAMFVAALGGNGRNE